jgi:hypothetical protein
LNIREQLGLNLWLKGSWLQKGALVSDEALALARATVTAGEARMGDWKEELRPADHAEEPTTASVPLQDGTPVSGTSLIESVPGPESSSGVLEEWIRDMEALEREIAEQEKVGVAHGGPAEPEM